MATLDEIATLDLIQEKRAKAKSNHLDVATQLSYSKKRFRSAINTMISVGALAVTVSILILIKEAVSTIVLIAKGASFTDDYWALILIGCELAVFVTTIVLGYKLYKLDSTPTFVLVSLIIILVANGLLCFGIFPLATVILSVIGLVRWSTYKNWFIAMDKARRKQSNKKKTQSRQKQLELETDANIDNYSASHSSTGWIVAFIIAVMVAIGAGVGFYFLGINQGKETGRKDGYSSGYDVGYDVGHSAGYRDGFSGGEASGYDRGYNQGYDDMWNKAVCIINGGGASCK